MRATADLSHPQTLEHKLLAVPKMRARLCVCVSERVAEPRLTPARPPRSESLKQAQKERISRPSSPVRRRA